jgi:hypothetical protein
MIKKLCVFTAAVIVVSTAMGQSTTKKSPGKISFTTINQVGLLTGSTGQAATVQSINGISINKWFVGAGAGIDYYGTRGVPLFLDVRRYLFSSDKSPFIYADGGVHVPWATRSQDEYNGYMGDYKKGAYFDGGVGMKLQTKSIGALLLSAGFSYKKVTEKAEAFTYYSFPNPEKTYEYFRSEYRRVVIKVGFQF